MREALSPETLDVLIKQMTAATVMMRSLALPGYPQALDLLARPLSSTLASLGSIRSVQWPAVTLVLAALLVPFAELSYAVRSLTQPPVVGWSKGASGFVCVVAAAIPGTATTLDGVPNAPDAPALPKRGVAAPPPLQPDRVVFELPASVVLADLTPQSIERGPPFFL